MSYRVSLLEPSLLKLFCKGIVDLAGLLYMNEEEQSLGEEEVASVCSLRKQVQVLRRLLEATETAVTTKRAKQEDMCLHSKKVLVSCGPRDNGAFDYQCVTCGAFL